MRPRHLAWLILPLQAACADRVRPGRVEISASECYTLAYAGGEDADTTMFPFRIALAPGGEGGAVTPIGADGDASSFWTMFARTSEWRRQPGDSIAATFSNGVSSTTLTLAHDGSRLQGVAAFRFEEGAEPYPLLEVRGARTDCPAP